jgi:hypothetical protein
MRSGAETMHLERTTTLIGSDLQRYVLMMVIKKTFVSAT